MKAPHYLAFVQALVLSAAIPACTSSADPEPAPTDEKTEPAPAKTEEPAAARTSDSPSATTAVAEPIKAPPTTAQPKAVADRDAGDDYSFSSGPIVPPELPASFA